MERASSRSPIYRELVVWQKAMDLAEAVYQLSPQLPREETYGMRSQITRAAVSIPANIAEGWARESRNEKAQFLAIAQGSLAEAETLLILCERIGWFQIQDTSIARGLMDEISRMLTTLRRKLRAERGRSNEE
jgi:four helix bundle protein